MLQQSVHKPFDWRCKLGDLKLLLRQRGYLRNQISWGISWTWLDAPYLLCSLVRVIFQTFQASHVRFKPLQKSCMIENNRTCGNKKKNCFQKLYSKFWVILHNEKTNTSWLGHISINHVQWQSPLYCRLGELRRTLKHYNAHSFHVLPLHHKE